MLKRILMNILIAIIKIPPFILKIVMFILMFLGPVFPITRDSLNTKKIDKNIQELLKSPWFDELYSSDKFRHLFFANKHVRKN